jgi:hypothetical protein
MTYWFSSKDEGTGSRLMVMVVFGDVRSPIRWDAEFSNNRDLES